MPSAVEHHDATCVHSIQVNIPLCSYRFMVVGSKGNHYTVTLQDEGPTCTCMDFRVRKRQCKHITLVLKGLCLRKASEWEAVCTRFERCVFAD